MVRRHLGQYSGSNLISLAQLPIILIGMPKKPQDPKPPAKSKSKKSKDNAGDPRPISDDIPIQPIPKESKSEDPR